MKVKVKNMVCDRCKKVLATELQKNGFQVLSIALGEVHFKDDVSDSIDSIRQVLEQNGFELIEQLHEVLIADIKYSLIKLVEESRTNKNVSEYLSNKLNKDYSVLSKLFSAKEGITIEKYFIRLKIEKVKELIQMNNKTFSEIAYDLNYTNSSYLAKQFKSITGMSMGDYKKSREWDRKSLDQIV